MSIQAAHAIRAAHNRRIWGTYAAARYAAKRGVPARLLILAIKLEGNHD